MNKVLDKKKQIFSCSPFAISFKLKSLSNEKLEGTREEKILNLLKFYFENTHNLCLSKEDETLIQKSKSFQNIIPEIFNIISNTTISTLNKEGISQEAKILDLLKDDDYLCLYMDDIAENDYIKCHEKYLQAKLFNVNDYNSDKEINPETFGVSDFINGTGAKFSKKPFLQHKTGGLHQGIASRIQAKDTVKLNKFELLQNNRVLPNPLPIFIDKDEFKDNTELVRIFNEEGQRQYSYPQLLKSIFENNEQRVLGNYYLLNMVRGVINDFDFVTNFQYYIKLEIKNLLQIKRNKELIKSIHIHTIFGFENIIVKKIFNNALVKEKDDKISYYYFNEIDPNYVRGGDRIANLILHYRKSFYDYIYKSRKQAITSLMLDKIMITSILSDIQNDEFRDGYHTNETSIKEKLNIWFSLYNHFNSNNTNRENMEKSFKDLIDKIELVANDPEVFIDQDDIGEFLFAAGQVIYFLLSKSKASNPTHALLEPFLQKSNVVQLQNAIANSINAYKHEISFYKDRFERLASQVLSFNTTKNLKNYQRYLLAGYFAPSCMYKSYKQTIQE
jgi:CRISPR-associated protein Csh1